MDGWINRSLNDVLDGWRDERMDIWMYGMMGVWMD